MILHFQAQDASEGDVLSCHPAHGLPGLHDHCRCLSLSPVYGYDNNRR